MSCVGGTQLLQHLVEARNARPSVCVSPDHQGSTLAVQGEPMSPTCRDGMHSGLTQISILQCADKKRMRSQERRSQHQQTKKQVTLVGCSSHCEKTVL
ncbi:hypothetical protein E2C01_005793 [Portunus trituberculatus]|uniref:Uncharacterized protein n=1 Tax=Portunus trituberculatus TaxID=210409 RepID=A0A5B7CWE6_PORTR|nr:hypothetical protein [Portunus trituberculatus]